MRISERCRERLQLSASRPCRNLPPEAAGYARRDIRFASSAADVVAHHIPEELNERLEMPADEFWMRQIRRSFRAVEQENISNDYFGGVIAMPRWAMLPCKIGLQVLFSSSAIFSTAARPDFVFSVEDDVDWISARSF